MSKDKKNFSPMMVAIALSLYRFNVAPIQRAKKIYAHFEGACMEINELADLMVDRKGFEATELPFPSAEVYVAHALEHYGEEAKHRVAVESQAIQLIDQQVTAIYGLKRYV